MPANHKRRAQRDKHDSVIEFFDDTGKLFMTGILVNCSRSGACFSTTHTMPRGQRLSANIRLLGKDVMKITARVVWSRMEHNTHLCGIEFDTIKNVYPAGEIKGSRV